MLPIQSRPGAYLYCPGRTGNPGRYGSYGCSITTLSSSHRRRRPPVPGNAPFPPPDRRMRSAASARAAGVTGVYTPIVNAKGDRGDGQEIQTGRGDLGPGRRQRTAAVGGSYVSQTEFSLGRRLVVHDGRHSNLEPAVSDALPGIHDDRELCNAGRHHQAHVADRKQPGTAARPVGSERRTVGPDPAERRRQRSDRRGRIDTHRSQPAQCNQNAQSQGLLRSERTGRPNYPHPERLPAYRRPA